MAINSSSFPLLGTGYFGRLFRQVFGRNQQSAYWSQNYLLNKNNPIYVDMENLMQVYLMCPHLRAVIDRFAEMFANAEIGVMDKDGKIVEGHEITKLLRNPNILQTQEAYMVMYAIQRNLYAQTFQYKLKPQVRFSDLPKALWCLPPAQMKAIPTGKIWDQTTVEGIIEKYVMLNYDDKREQDFETGSIIHSTDGISNLYIVGKSKVLSLEKPISNIMGALRTRNCIIFDRGGLGILSTQSKDGAGAIPLGVDERKMISRQLPTDYGIQDGQLRTIITNASLAYTSMTFPTKDLMLFEEIEDDFSAILGTFGMSRDIFPSVKGATFENAEQAVRQTYQNTIQPFADSYCRSLEQDKDIAKSLKNGERIFASYDHLPVMKDDEVAEYNAKKAKAEAYGILIDKGIVSKEQVAEEFGIEYETPDAKTLQEQGIAQAQTQLRGTVGGLDGIIALNAAVSNGDMERDKAVNTLVNYYGYEQSIADSMITTTVKPTPSPKPIAP